jgi:hypothetical protein
VFINQITEVSVAVINLSVKEILRVARYIDCHENVLKCLSSEQRLASESFPR